MKKCNTSLLHLQLPNGMAVKSLHASDKYILQVSWNLLTHTCRNDLFYSLTSVTQYHRANFMLELTYVMFIKIKRSYPGNQGDRVWLKVSLEQFMYLAQILQQHVGQDTYLNNLSIHILKKGNSNNSCHGLLSKYIFLSLFNFNLLD